MDTAAKYNLKVLLDVHAVKDSQNGFDNSGKALDMIWTDDTHFKHWSVLNASWMGTWDGEKYTSINEENIEFAIDTVKGLMNKWGFHEALYALEPVNEPWWNSDLPTLKSFYKTTRNIVRNINPKIIFVFHDSFLSNAETWNDLFNDNDMENVVLDTHKYLAWNAALSTIGSYCDTYGSTMFNADIQNIKYPIWVGEWSLATDVCAMWLGGFNDANSPAQFPCQKVQCPYTYMKHYGTDFNRNDPNPLGPFAIDGESNDYSTITQGMCLTDSSTFSDDDVKTLGDCTSSILDQTVSGQFLWNFRNELEPRWSYIEAYDNGWLNAYQNHYQKEKVTE